MSDFFKKSLAEKVKKGHHYSTEPLSNVEFGFNIAIEEICKYLRDKYKDDDRVGSILVRFWYQKIANEIESLK